MDLEKLQEQADKDLKINDTELDLESLKTPQLHNQYMKHLTKYKLMLSRAETEYNTLKREKWEYYTGKADASVYAEKPFDLKILRTDIDKYLDSDEDLQNWLRAYTFVMKHREMMKKSAMQEKKSTEILVVSKILNTKRKSYFGFLKFWK